MTRADLHRLAARKRVREHLETGRSLTRLDALDLLHLKPGRFETAINDLRKQGARINKFKGAYGAWVYVAHEKGLFENLENSSQTKTERLL